MSHFGSPSNLSKGGQMDLLSIMAELDEEPVPPPAVVPAEEPARREPPDRVYGAYTRLLIFLCLCMHLSIHC